MVSLIRIRVLSSTYDLRWFSISIRRPDRHIGDYSRLFAIELRHSLTAT